MRIYSKMHNSSYSDVSFISKSTNKFKGAIKYVRDIAFHFINNELNLGEALATILLSVRYFRNAGLYPRYIKTVDNFKVFINDPATLLINIFDQYVRREYELHPEFIPRKGWNIVDAGAYVGLFSLRASKLVGSKGLILAFEPNPMAWYWLKQNIAVNNANNILAFPVALGDYNGVAKLNVVLKGNIEASSLINEHIVRKIGKEVENIMSIKVPIYRLDYILNKLNIIKHIDLMKIDVEGAEMNVLRGSEDLISRGKVLRLVIEVHLDVIREQDLLNFLREHRYKIIKSIAFDNVKKIVYAYLQ